VDATAQAKAALAAFLAAWQAGNLATFNSLTTTRMAAEATSNIKSSRMEVGTITPVAPIAPPVLPVTGGPYRSWTFKATVRFWGGDQSVEDGERLDYTWFVIQGSDGRWLVSDWGY
jgi:hypothetical protein